ncbi:hypothetical protein BDZ90DRAFT_70670 [Jaminaea rosea]|uniref:Uncharacterized protein n=1 Tax=Jaminaea rosea TaxID=1569628 RepID=A0A316UKA6_9BASI|nr:hypothetical protein BDZ90DRAFT_70670 [Jaminaea rosea]PWN25660.1 hypothetical protein BDZ90DRAFT_70670 [Jaminaea rosea]
MRFTTSTSIALLTIAAAFSPASALPSSSYSPCRVKYNFDSSNPLDMDLRSFALTLQQGSACAYDQVHTASTTFAAYAQQGASLAVAGAASGASTVESNAQAAALAGSQYAQQFAAEVAASYTYLARLYGQAKTFFATYETQLAASDVGQAVASFQALYLATCKALADFKPYAPFMTSAQRAVRDLDAAEADFTSSLQRYGGKVYARVQPVAGDAEQALGEMVGAMRKGEQAVKNLGKDAVGVQV